ncbi:GGDEF domain-containing protein [Thermomonas sp.]|uniref:GGDEF domain-containing protein n=1 Tax=Thermomonas sp. TaxID=1971895 RepID=UPI002615494A|nr:GGDEF domain-containing protein [Thermomonas sp.]
MALPPPTAIHLIDAFGAGVYALTIINQVDLWWHRRHRRTHLWLALSATGALLVDISGFALRTDTDPHAGWLGAVNMLGVALALVSLHELTLAIVHRRSGKHVRIVESATLVAPGLIFVLPAAPVAAAMMLAAVLFLLTAMWQAIRSARSGDPEAHVIAQGLSLLFLILIYDVLSDQGLLPRVYGTPVFGFSFLYVCAARAMRMRYDREHRELQDLRTGLEQRVQLRTEQLEAANRQLALLSRTDALTGLANRRSFIESTRARLHDAPGALVMIDVDHFKQINDRHGHATGDEALRAVASALGAIPSAHELVARWGGEEFIALLEPDGAAARVERLRLTLHGIDLQAEDGSKIALRASFGLTFVANGEDLDAAIARADHALYEAKRGGRDRLVVAPG